jgi:hypothetical protein
VHRVRHQHPARPARRPGTAPLPPRPREDRIRAARATGLRNLPFHDSAQNQVWLEIVQLALDLLAWMPMLALDDHTRRWEPKTLRYRLLHTAARLTHGGRIACLRFPKHWPWTQLITAALARLRTLPDPG